MTMRTEVRGGAKQETPPRILLVSCKGWPVAAHVAIALQNSGFQVAAISSKSDLIRTLNAVARHYDYAAMAPGTSIAVAVASWAPTLVLPTDDAAVIQLHHLHRHLAKREGNEAVLTVIRESLGDPAFFEVARAKSRFIQFASQLGVRCPKTRIVDRESQLLALLPEFGCPAVIKADGTSGGGGVRVVSSAHDAGQAFRNVHAQNSWARFVPERYRSSFADCRVVTLQQYIKGRNANTAVFCARGSVLAHVSVEVCESLVPNGPGSVVRTICNNEMAATASLLVAQLKLSGYVGFDFLIDEHDQAWLLEMNPRVTPTCHLTFSNGFSLPNTFAKFVADEGPGEIASPPLNETIALFPQEWLREPASDYIRTLRHDVPWQEPLFVAACLKSADYLKSNSRWFALTRTWRLGKLARQIASRSVLKVANPTTDGSTN